LSAVAAERSRLARDLHDSVTQTLFAASLTADVLPRLWERSPAKGQAQLETLRQLTRSALAEMRTLVYELRPQVLVRTPMHELLEQLGEALRVRAQVAVTVSAPNTLELPAEVQMALYRIAQEAGNNIAKHAKARQVLFRIEPLTAPSGVRLTIEDDGIGFDTTHTAPTTLGLDIMRERAADSHATLDIQSQPGAGTTITVQWRQNAYD
jgi:signal transduction histidine kinase